MEMTRERLLRIVQRRIQKTLREMSQSDAESLADDIVFDIDTAMESADSGSGIRPIRLEEERPVLPPAPARVTVDPAQAAVAAVGEKGQVIAMPGDPEFEEVVKTKAIPVRTGSLRRVIADAPLTPEQIRRRASNSPDQMYWTPESLIQEIEQGTPETIEFVPDGMPEEWGGKTLRATRNIVNQQGLGLVNLHYAHESAKQEIGSLQEGVNLPLVAVFSFNVYQKSLDFEDAISGPKGIVAQLQALYRRRPAAMMPIMGLEEPLRPEMAAASGRVSTEIRGGNNWNMVADPKSSTLQGVIDSNRQNSPKTER